MVANVSMQKLKVKKQKPVGRIGQKHILKYTQAYSDFFFFFNRCNFNTLGLVCVCVFF